MWSICLSSFLHLYLFICKIVYIHGHGLAYLKLRWFEFVLFTNDVRFSYAWVISLRFNNVEDAFKQ